MKINAIRRVSHAHNGYAPAALWSRKRKLWLNEGRADAATVLKECAYPTLAGTRRGVELIRHRENLPNLESLEWGLLSVIYS